MIDQLVEAYASATTRLLIFDYDGVLAPIVPRPELARPSDEVVGLLRKLSAQLGTQVVIVSGRDRETLDRWLGKLPVDMSAEHGHFYKESGVWHPVHETDMSWVADVELVMKSLVDTYPGSHIESKQASLVWHFREVERPVDERGAKRQLERAAGNRATVMPGKRVIDVRALGADKGMAARHWYDARGWDFVLCIGDDITDEAMFAALPEPAWTIKIGPGPTSARHQFKRQTDVMKLLRTLASDT